MSYRWCDRCKRHYPAARWAMHNLVWHATRKDSK